jgi:PQQ-like domain
MRWTRTLGIWGTVAAVTALGLAAPAYASYRSSPIALPWNPAGPVHSSVSRNGVVYVGGKLDGTGGIAALDVSTGDLLWQLPADNDVRALALSDDGTRLYAGGAFTAVDGLPHQHLAAINTADHSVVGSWNARAAGPVRDLVVRGNTVYVAGKISSVDGVTQRGMGAVNATTGLRRASFAFSADNDVLGMALTGSRLVISGSFSHINGAARASLASINLSTDHLTKWAPPRLCGRCTQYWDVQTDGTNAYVATSGNAAGAFNLQTGQHAWRRIRGDGDFQAVWLPGDGKVYFGGHFGKSVWVRGEKQNAVPATVVASVFISTGQIDASWTPKIYHVYPGCWTFTSAGRKLWVGGDFTGEQVNGSNNHKPFLAAYPRV